MAGLLVQVLPGHQEDVANSVFDDVAACADTVSTAELTELAADLLLPKLFAGHAIRLVVSAVNGEFHTSISDIGSLEHQGRCQSMLNSKIGRHHIWIL